MQTQVQQSGKKNKMAVPFYSPPYRLQGQTSAEIIKEARQAVMGSNAIGIKPVFTSRPFTPKENERTLFGNVKRKNGRPPSSFSLKNIQPQDFGSRVKLPSIEIFSKTKAHTSLQRSNNLSLDNLAEDCASEALEEIKGSYGENLPAYRKSHSCPKERRMIKAVSYNEIRGQVSTEKKDELKETISDNLHKIEKTYKSTSLNKENGMPNSKELSLNASKLLERNAGDISASYSPSPFQYFNSIRGAGDFEETENYAETLLVEDHLIDELNLNEKEDLPVKSNQKGILREEKTETDNNCRQEENLKKGGNEYKPSNQKQEEFLKTVDDSYEELMKTDQIKNESGQSKFFGGKEVQENGTEKIKSLAEKSISTAPKCNYLTSLTQSQKNSYQEKQSISIPSEIIDLYETAYFYETVIDNENSSKMNINAVKNEEIVPNVDKYFGEKSNDYINGFNNNIEKIVEKEINERDRNLDRTSEKTSEKCYQSNDSKSLNKGSSLNQEQFIMNNRKRYHVTGDKGEAKEKAYKKWNNKQKINNSLPQQTEADESWDLFWKNSYFRNDEANSKEKENKEESNALGGVQGLINKIKGFARTETENNNVYDSTCQLYQTIKKNEVILDQKLKENIQKTLYMFADNEDPKILVSLSRLLLYVKIDHSLSVACKMIFKVARFDTNDHLFLNEEDILELFLDGIGRASPLDYAESCIYGYGALKFLTMNYNILSRILHLGALDLMTLHLKMINTAHQEKGSVGEQTQHALFQLTGALRHVAAGEGALPLFVTTNCIPVLCKTLQLFQNDEDIVTNISRTLSLLSTDENIVHVLMSVENILVPLIDLMDRYKLNEKILIRLSFCLGNIVEHSDLARVQLSRSDASLTILLSILGFYIDKDLEMLMKKSNEENLDELNSQTVDDIIIKVIRIIANMSMNPIVGSNLSPATNKKRSLQLSKLLAVLLMRKDPGITLLATLGCLNNISYYCNAHSVLIDITQGIERVLELQSEDCQAEAARVLGNLTRHEEIRDLIYTTGGINKLIKLLTSQNQEVVRCVCGALVNLMLDSKTRQQFLEAHGVDKLVEALELFSGDWSLASLAARVIWNSCANDFSTAMLHNNVEHLLNILANSLEEENWNDGNAAWEEYAAISTDLLEKINSHLEAV